MIYYCAFSVHGTNKFFVATKEARSLADLGPGFTEVASRRPKFYPFDMGHKVHWTKLVREDGQPFKNTLWVHRRFNTLRDQGWKIVKRAGVTVTE